MVVRFQWPESSGYEEFVRQHGESLLRLAVLLTGNRHDAEDVLQDAVIAVARRWERLRPETALAYIRTAVARKALDVKRRPALSPLDALADPGGVELGYLRLEEDVEFVRLLAGLPPKQRAVLVLRYYADVDDASVGKALGCSVQTVRSQASRALAKLRERLGAPSAAVPGGELDGSGTTP